MRSRRARIVGAVAVGATMLAACSRGTSKEDFIAAADDVCREADERIAEIGGPRGEDGVREYVEQAKEISSDLVADLRELEPPDGDEAAAGEVIAGLERATELLEPLAQATIDRNADEAEELQQAIEQLTDDVNEAAESYGFEVCGAKVLGSPR